MQEKIVYLHYKLKSHRKISRYILKDPSLKKVNQNDANNYCQTLNCQFTTLLSKDFPTKLKLLPNPPWVIYFKGDINLLNTSVTGLISDFYLTNYAKFVTADFLKQTKATDTILCCENIGVAKVVQAMNSKQMKVILAQDLKSIDLSKKNDASLILTTNLSNNKRQKLSNDIHILPALCDNLVIIEAAINSNINKIVERSIDLGVEIYAVPGNIYAPKSQGTNQLIQDGANIVQWIKEV